MMASITKCEVVEALISIINLFGTATCRSVQTLMIIQAARSTCITNMCPTELASPEGRRGCSTPLTVGNLPSYNLVPTLTNPVARGTTSAIMRERRLLYPGSTICRPSVPLAAARLYELPTGKVSRPTSATSHMQSDLHDHPWTLTMPGVSCKAGSLRAQSNAQPRSLQPKFSCMWPEAASASRCDMEFSNMLRVLAPLPMLQPTTAGRTIEIFFLCATAAGMNVEISMGPEAVISMSTI